MNIDLAKSLTDLIDETLAEIEALRKSDRFEAEEIDMGHDKDGEMKPEEMAAKAEDEEEKEEEAEEEADDMDKAEDEEEKEEEAEEEEKEEMDKAEAYRKAEEECAKAEKMYKEAMKKRDMCKADMEDKDDKEEEKDEDREGINLEKKLSKSIDARIAPLQSQISELVDFVKQIADTPVPARGISYKGVQPLAKSNEVEPLSKSQVLDQLITLKKSGKEIATEDVLKAEIGSQDDLQTIVSKYGIK
jgi:hypothetical protein